MRTEVTADRVIVGDGTVHEPGTVAFEDARLRAVGADATGDADRSIALDDFTVLPGLIDGHLHLFYPGAKAGKHADLVRTTPSEHVIRAIDAARRTVDAGVTAVRDMAGPTDVVPTIRDAIADGTVVGPRVRTAAQGITATGGHGDLVPWHVDRHLTVEGGAIGSKGYVADGVIECHRAVRELLDRGADFIKVWASGGIVDAVGAGDTVEFSPAELDAIVAEADRHGVEVAAHAHNPPAIIAAAEAGVTAIEHAMFMNEPAIDAMAANDVTLTLTRSSMTLLTERDHVQPHVQENARGALAHQAEMLPTALDAGVEIAMGTDTGGTAMAHGENALELECLVDVGFDPHEAIRVSTAGTAGLVGLEGEVGVLEPGYRADLIAVRGNPLTDVSVLSDPDNVELVVIDGEVVKDRVGAQSGA